MTDYLPTSKDEIETLKYNGEILDSNQFSLPRLSILTRINISTINRFKSIANFFQKISTANSKTNKSDSDKQKQIDISSGAENMPTNPLWTDESLSNNATRMMSKLRDKAHKQGMSDKEIDRQIAIYYEYFKDVPMVTLRDESGLKSILTGNDLISAHELGYNKNVATHTGQNDIDQGLDQYVFGSWGYPEGGLSSSRYGDYIFVINPDIMREPNTIVTISDITNSAANGLAGYKKSAIRGEDFIRLMTLSAIITHTNPIEAITSNIQGDKTVSSEIESEIRSWRLLAEIKVLNRIENNNISALIIKEDNEEKVEELTKKATIKIPTYPIEVLSSNPLSGNVFNEFTRLAWNIRRIAKNPQSPQLLFEDQTDSIIYEYQHQLPNGISFPVQLKFRYGGNDVEYAVDDLITLNRLVNEIFVDNPTVMSLQLVFSDTSFSGEFEYFRPTMEQIKRQLIPDMQKDSEQPNPPTPIDTTSTFSKRWSTFKAWLRSIFSNNAIPTIPATPVIHDEQSMLDKEQKYVNDKLSKYAGIDARYAHESTTEDGYVADMNKYIGKVSVKKAPKGPISESGLETIRTNLDSEIDRLLKNTKKRNNSEKHEILTDQKNRFIDLLKQAIDEGDIAMTGDKVMTLQSIQDIILRNIHTLAYQDFIASENTLGDHGLRHLVQHNITIGEKVLDLAKEHDTHADKSQQIRAIDYLILHQVMIDHDTGYAMDIVRQGVNADATKGYDSGHNVLAAKMLRQRTESGLDPLSQLFGAEGVARIHQGIMNHDSSAVDISLDRSTTVESAIHLADNTHAFESKLPELLYGTPESIITMRLLKAAGEIGDDQLIESIKLKLISQIQSRSDLGTDDKVALTNAVKTLTKNSYSFTVGRIMGNNPTLDFVDGKLVVSVVESEMHQDVVRLFDKESYDQLAKFIADLLGIKKAEAIERIQNTDLTSNSDLKFEGKNVIIQALIGDKLKDRNKSLFQTKLDELTRQNADFASYLLGDANYVSNINALIKGIKLKLNGPKSLHTILSTLGMSNMIFRLTDGSTIVFTNIAGSLSYTLYGADSSYPEVSRFLSNDELESLLPSSNNIVKVTHDGAELLPGSYKVEKPNDVVAEIAELERQLAEFKKARADLVKKYLDPTALETPVEEGSISTKNNQSDDPTTPPVPPPTSSFRAQTHVVASDSLEIVSTTTGYIIKSTGEQPVREKQLFESPQDISSEGIVLNYNAPASNRLLIIGLDTYQVRFNSQTQSLEITNIVTGQTEIITDHPSPLLGFLSRASIWRRNIVNAILYRANPNRFVQTNLDRMISTRNRSPIIEGTAGLNSTELLRESFVRSINQKSGTNYRAKTLAYVAGYLYNSEDQNILDLTEVKKTADLLYKYLDLDNYQNSGRVDLTREVIDLSEVKTDDNLSLLDHLDQGHIIRIEGPSYTKVISMRKVGDLPIYLVETTYDNGDKPASDGVTDSKILANEHFPSMEDLNEDYLISITNEKNANLYSLDFFHLILSSLDLPKAESIPDSAKKYTILGDSIELTVTENGYLLKAIPGQNVKIQRYLLQDIPEEGILIDRDGMEFWNKIIVGNQSYDFYLSSENILSVTNSLTGEELEFIDLLTPSEQRTHKIFNFLDRVFNPIIDIFSPTDYLESNMSRIITDLLDQTHFTDETINTGNLAKDTLLMNLKYGYPELSLEEATLHYVAKQLFNQDSPEVLALEEVQATSKRLYSEFELAKYREVALPTKQEQLRTNVAFNWNKSHPSIKSELLKLDERSISQILDEGGVITLDHPNGDVSMHYKKDDRYLTQLNGAVVGEGHLSIQAMFDARFPSADTLLTSDYHITIVDKNNVQLEGMDLGEFILESTKDYITPDSRSPFRQWLDRFLGREIGIVSFPDLNVADKPGHITMMLSSDDNAISQTSMFDVPEYYVQNVTTIEQYGDQYLALTQQDIPLPSKNPYWNKYSNFGYSSWGMNGPLSHEEVKAKIKDSNTQIILLTTGLDSNSKEFIHPDNSLVHSLYRNSKNPENILILAINAPGFGLSSLKESEIKLENVSTLAFREEVSQYALEMELPRDRTILVGHSKAGEMSVAMGDYFDNVIAITPSLHPQADSTFIILSTLNRIGFSLNQTPVLGRIAGLVRDRITTYMLRAENGNTTAGQSEIHQEEQTINPKASLLASIELQYADQDVEALPSNFRAFLGRSDRLTSPYKAIGWFKRHISNHNLNSEIIDTFVSWMEGAGHVSFATSPGLAESIAMHVHKMLNAPIPIQEAPGNWFKNVGSEPEVSTLNHNFKVTDYPPFQPIRIVTALEVVDQLPIVRTAKGDPISLIKYLGGGNFGNTYLARNNTTNEQFVIKIANDNQASYDVAMQEYQYLKHVEKTLESAKLSTNDVVKARELVYFTDQNSPVIGYAMDYIEGEPLIDIINHGEKVSQEDLDSIRRTAAKLDSQNLPWTDIWPANMIKTPDGKIVFIDPLSPKSLDGESAITRKLTTEITELGYEKYIRVFTIPIGADNSDTVERLLLFDSRLKP